MKTAPDKRITEDILHVLSFDRDVADALGLSLTELPSHVFDGIAPSFQNGRNRGRLPYLEAEVSTSRRNRYSPGGGEGVVNVTVRARTSTFRNQTHTGLSNILQACFQAIVSWKFTMEGDRFPGYLAPDASQAIYEDAEESVSSETKDFMSAYRDLSLTIRYDYAQETLGAFPFQGDFRNGYEVE